MKLTEGILNSENVSAARTLLVEGKVTLGKPTPHRNLKDFAQSSGSKALRESLVYVWKVCVQCEKSMEGDMVNRLGADESVKGLWIHTSCWSTEAKMSPLTGLQVRPLACLYESEMDLPRSLWAPASIYEGQKDDHCLIADCPSRVIAFGTTTRKWEGLNGPTECFHPSCLIRHLERKLSGADDRPN